MSLKEHTYSVLIVSSARSFDRPLTALLPKSLYSPVNIATGVGAARRAASEKNFDFIIISSPLPDDTGIQFAKDLSSTRKSVVLLLVHSELFDEVNDAVIEYGVFTLQLPTSRTSLLTALNWMTSARELLRQAEKKTLSIEEKMNEIKIINRAKWMLINEYSMDEPAAHRYIEKQAMDCCASRLEIAESIIKHRI